MSAKAAEREPLRDLKERSLALAKRHASRADDETREQRHEQESAGIRAFLAWFKRQRAAGTITMPSEDMLDVQPELSREFCVGIHDMRYFIGIPRECVEWFFELPWLHAAISTAASRLSLVCERVRAPGLEVPAFALNFTVHPESYIKGMAHYHYLDVRVVDIHQQEESRYAISREVYMTLDIRSVSTERSFRAVLDGRLADGFQNRSIARAKGGR